MPSTTEITPTSYRLSAVPENYSLVVRFIDGHFVAEVTVDGAVWGVLTAPRGASLVIS